MSLRVFLCLLGISIVIHGGIGWWTVRGGGSINASLLDENEELKEKIEDLDNLLAYRNEELAKMEKLLKDEKKRALDLEVELADYQARGGDSEKLAGDNLELLGEIAKLQKIIDGTPVGDHTKQECKFKPAQQQKTCEIIFDLSDTVQVRGAIDSQKVLAYSINLTNSLIGDMQFGSEITGFGVSKQGGKYSIGAGTLPVIDFSKWHTLCVGCSSENRLVTSYENVLPGVAFTDIEDFGKIPTWNAVQGMMQFTTQGKILYKLPGLDYSTGNKMSKKFGCDNRETLRKAVESVLQVNKDNRLFVIPFSYYCPGNFDIVPAFVQVEIQDRHEVGRTGSRYVVTGVVDGSFYATENKFGKHGVFLKKDLNVAIQKPWKKPEGYYDFPASETVENASKPVVVEEEFVDVPEVEEDFHRGSR